VIGPWAPPATVCADGDNVKDGLQAPEPPMLVLTVAQVTVTAETGTVGQVLKLEEPACTVKLQFPWAKSRFVQLTEAVELPESVGDESGLVALNVMVAGLTLTVKPAAGTTVRAAAFFGSVGSLGDTGRKAGGPAAANNIVMAIHAPIGCRLGRADSKRGGRRVCAGSVGRIVGQGPRYGSGIARLH
jgi:hypothetical protein